MKRWRFLLLVGTLLMAACAPDAPKESAPSDSSSGGPPVINAVPAGTGTIAGEVVFAGKVIPRKKIVVNKDTQVCGTEKESEELVVGPNNGVQWALVSLQMPPDPNGQKTGTVTLDQKGCRFQPHVLLVPMGGSVKILNPDGVLHNFHSDSTVNPPVNKAQPKFKKEMYEVFGSPEIFRIKCDAHSWMSGWIVVTEHPFYGVTDANGGFELKGVPAGKQILKVWHETLGKVAQIEVEVKAGKTAYVTIGRELLN